MSILGIFMATLLFSLGAFGFTPSQGATIGDFHFFQCQKEGSLCVEVQGSRAWQSILSPIYALPSMTITLRNRRTSSVVKKRQGNGYIDFSNHQVVVTEKNNHIVKEIMLDLRTFDEKSYIMGGGS